MISYSLLVLSEKQNIILRDGAEVARQAHNLKVVGSIPTPATNFFYINYN